jgi:hypothetical protein
MRLSELLARNVTVETYEAIAVVREVADRVTESSQAAPAVPDLHQIELASDGQIRIRPGVKIGEPVRRLGQLLQAMLSQSSPAVQVRLVISQAMAPEPAYPSIKEYSEALAYFERPGRAGIIRALRARADESPERSQGSAPPTLDGMAPLLGVPPAPSAEQDRSVPRSRRVVRVAALAAVLLIAAAAAVAYAGSAKVRNGAPDVSAAVMKISDALGVALVSRVSVMSERVGLGRFAPANQAAVVPAVPVMPRVRGTNNLRASAVARTIVPVAAFDLDSRRADSPEPATVDAVRADVPLVLASRELPDVSIYSLHSAGVVPPVGVRPQLPRELPDNVNPDDLGRIDLVIAEDGTVQSVKLLGNRRSVHDAMMLSAAKAWEFTPALKDGHPVKYRKTVWISMQ